jgi:hypothetical protein
MQQGVLMVLAHQKMNSLQQQALVLLESEQNYRTQTSILQQLEQQVR